jgi:hypothetical protein
MGAEVNSLKPQAGQSDVVGMSLESFDVVDEWLGDFAFVDSVMGDHRARFLAGVDPFGSHFLAVPRMS